MEIKMHPIRKRRLMMIIGIVLGVSIATALVLIALNQNINLYFTPTQVVKGIVPIGKTIRIGGLVQANSLRRLRRAQKNLEVNFVITDNMNHRIQVEYSGVLPDLFREGQGIIAEGKLNAKGIFLANEVLAKHSETYTPPKN